MNHFEYTEARNGQIVSHRSGSIPSDRVARTMLELMAGKTPSLMIDAMELATLPPEKRKEKEPPRSNKEHCDVTFPPSNAWVNPETMEVQIVLAANDVKDDEYRVDLEGDIIIVTFDRKREEGSMPPVYDWRGLRFVTNEIAKFKFDPLYHDASTTDVKLERGCLWITMQPRKEVKPVHKTIAGGLKKAKQEE